MKAMARLPTTSTGSGRDINQTIPMDSTPLWGPRRGTRRLRDCQAVRALPVRPAHVEAGVGEDVGCCVSVLPAQVGEEDVLAGADAPGDGLADLAGSDDYGDFGHG